MSPSRPAARGGRSLTVRIQTTLYRHRWIRWAAAVGAALIVMAALSNDRSDPPPVASEPPGPADLLPPGTRGVPVPVESETFAAGDSVDLHAVLDGAAVVHAALVVEARAEELIVAVPASQVDATVDALATGGVILVLVPPPNPSDSQADTSP